MAGAAFLALVALAGLAGWWAVSSPGPNRALTAWRRYGLVPVAIAAATALVTAALFIAPLAVAVAAVGAAVAVPRVWRWAWIAGRVAVIRLRWPSVARAAGLAVTKDRRGRGWPFDSTLDLKDQTVEYLPVISRPWPVPGGARFRIVPARGGTMADVEEVAERLAAGLRVGAAQPVRFTPYRGAITFLWTDRLADIDPDDLPRRRK